MTKTKLLALFAIIGVISSISAYSAYAVGGYTETTQKAGQIVASGKWFTAFDVGTIQAATAKSNTLVAYPIELANDTNISALGMAYTASSPTTTCRTGVYSDDGNGNPGTLIIDSGNFTKARYFQSNSVSTTLSAGIYHLAMNCNGANGIYGFNDASGQVYGQSFTNNVAPDSQYGGVTASQTFGDGSNALPSTFPSVSGHSQIVPFIALQRQ